MLFLVSGRNSEAGELSNFGCKGNNNSGAPFYQKPGNFEMGKSMRKATRAQKQKASLEIQKL